MENIKIKRKEFEISEIVSKDTFKGVFKDNTYLIKKYDPNSESFSNLKILMKSSISIPSVKYIDKKSGYVAFEMYEGTLISDYILDHDFDENIYKQIFRNSYYARLVGLTLDYSLDKWMLCGNQLVYVSEYCEKYDPKNDFTKWKMREWFFTKELAEFYKKNGILFDKKRIKKEFAANKEMVLMTCKYYI